MKQLPEIMVAPNGARKTKADHPAIPIAIEETVATAKACFEAGATALHAHVRDEEEKHVLDAGLYKELLAEMSLQVPSMDVQITTEAVGRYSPQEQRQLVYDVEPEAVSVAIKEMTSDGHLNAAKRFYHWAQEADIAVQHIVFSDEELRDLIRLHRDDVVPGPLQLMLVLGRYTANQQSDPAVLIPFLDVLRKESISADWAVCAFGSNETVCLEASFRAGGKARVGFENSLWNADGSLAKDNVERVKAIVALRQSL